MEQQKTAMDAVDTRDRQAFAELQQKLIGFTGKLQQVRLNSAEAALLRVIDLSRYLMFIACR